MKSDLMIIAVCSLGLSQVCAAPPAPLDEVLTRLYMTEADLRSTSYTLGYRINTECSAGYFTESPFWVPQSVGDKDVITVQQHGRLTVAVNEGTLFIDDRVLEMTGTKIDGTTKSLDRAISKHNQVWRTPDGRVYVNSKEGLIYDSFTNTAETSDTFLLDSILYSNALWPGILNSLKIVQNFQEVWNYDFPNLKTTATGNALNVSFTMPQKLHGHPFRQTWIINSADRLLERESLYRPTSAGYELFIDRHSTFGEVDGVVYKASYKTFLNSNFKGKTPLLEWQIEGKPVINKPVSLPDFKPTHLVYEYR